VGIVAVAALVLANRTRRDAPPLHQLEKLAQRAERVLQTNEPTQELVAAWVQFLRQHVADAVNALNNRHNAIALLMKGLERPDLNREQTDVIQRVRAELGWATNITAALVQRVSSEVPSVPPTGWNILQDAAQSPARILVVEPDESNRSAIVSLLRGLGHEVTGVANSYESWDYLNRHSADCILTDVRLPLVGGRTLYEQVEEKLPHLARRFVFVTGDQGREESNRFLAESRQPVVTKPYELETLVAAIATVLQSVGPAPDGDGGPSAGRDAPSGKQSPERRA